MEENAHALSPFSEILVNKFSWKFDDIKNKAFKDIKNIMTK